MSGELKWILHAKSDFREEFANKNFDGIFSLWHFVKKKKSTMAT